MEAAILKMEQVSHRYTGSWAIRDIDFEISHKGVLGLLGSNGAGKSTTMGIMCGVINQTQGRVLVNGIDMRKHPKEAKKHIGFLPQNPPLHLDLTIDEYLTHCAHMRRMDKKAIPAAVKRVKEQCGIGHFSHRLIANLSGGYRQRVGIAQAIIHEPSLVVLDEPTNGLDPNQIAEVRLLIKQIAEERAVIFSSHILSEIDATCQEIKMIENGRLIFSDTRDAFNSYIAPNSLVMQVGVLPSEESILAIPGVMKVNYLAGNRVRVYFDTSLDVAETIIKTSVQQDWRMQEITLEKSSLDDIFAQLSNKSTTFSHS